jgi:hypothetical protein
MNKNSDSFTPIQNVWINDVQVLTARSNNGLYLATHGGHNGESHNHNDVGDFIIYANDEPVIIDAGRGNYTARTFSPQRYELWFTQSQYHNLPIVNGYGQLAGKEFTASNVKNSLEVNRASLSMNIANAYDSMAGIKYWNRKVTFDRQKNQVQIADEYAMHKTLNSLQQIFMTVCKADLTTPGEILLTTNSNQVYVIRYDKSNWTPSIEQPSTDGSEYSVFKIKWNGKAINRIIMSRKNIVTADKYSFIIEKK